MYHTAKLQVKPPGSTPVSQEQVSEATVGTGSIKLHSGKLENHQPGLLLIRVPIIVFLVYSIQYIYSQYIVVIVYSIPIIASECKQLHSVYTQDPMFSLSLSSSLPNFYFIFFTTSLHSPSGASSSCSIFKQLASCATIMYALFIIKKQQLFNMNMNNNSFEINIVLMHI